MDSKPEYEMLLLSELLKKSRDKPHPDFLAAVAYIFQRLEGIGSAPSSQFNKKMRWLPRIMPRLLVIKVLYRCHYDALIGICRQGQIRKIYGMLSFQKHPAKGRIGMFDIYLSPSHRDKDLLSNFGHLAALVYGFTQKFCQCGYSYIQCGNNAATRRLLRVYERVCRKNSWDCRIDVAQTRIYL